MPVSANEFVIPIACADVASYVRIGVVLLQKIACPKAFIDPHGEKEEILWRSGQHLIHRLDVFASTDGGHPDLSALLQMVWVLLCAITCSFRQEG